MRSRGRISGVSSLPVAALVVACLTVSCSGAGAGRSPSGELALEAPLASGNIILIVNDTMRRDRLGIHGGAARTPAFDRFAREGLLFERAYTQSPWTKPSMVTLFTSLYPSQHGVLSHPVIRERLERDDADRVLTNDVLSGDLTTLAEILRDAGFRTAAFVGNPWMRKEFGFDQGFETYDDSFADWDLPGSELTRAGLEWLERLPPGQRFFLYLHYMDSHRPYPPVTMSEIHERSPLLRADTRDLEDGARAEIAKLVRLPDGRPAVLAGIGPSVSLLEMAYDHGLEQFDRALASFLERFSGRPQYSNTAIVVTSDHGEALFTRGYGNHGGGLYEDEVAIPLAARLPGVSAAGFRIDTPIGLVDLMPTLCDYLDVACPATAQGSSLFAAGPGRPEAGRRPIAIEGVMAKPANRAIRVGYHKLLWQPQRGRDGGGHALFNLAADPLERRNLLSAEYRTERTEALFQLMANAARDAIPAIDAPQSGKMVLEFDLLMRLQSLGYVD